MFRNTILAATSLMLLATAPSFAAQCRDAKGKFVKCADVKPPAPTRCKDAKGKFVKCGMPGAKPM